MCTPQQSEAQLGVRPHLQDVVFVHVGLCRDAAPIVPSVFPFSLAAHFALSPPSSSKNNTTLFTAVCILQTEGSP